MNPLSRRQLLLAGSALVLAGCTGPAIVRPTASPTGSIRSQLDDVLTIIANGSNKLGVALFDQRSKFMAQAFERSQVFIFHFSPWR